MLVRQQGFSDAELDRFRSLQRLSFRILEETAAGLAQGCTEQEVGRALVKRYRAEGVRSFFHLPVVLFGERTALPGRWTLGHFYPRPRALAPGDAVILDASPIFGGYLVDTSYSFCFGEDDEHRRMMRDLSRFRADVCDAVNEGRRFSEIAVDVAAELVSRGYEPVHRKHPGEVLGHRALRVPELPFTWRLRGFDGASLGWFLAMGRAASAGLVRGAPTWNQRRTSDHPPLDGLWLVEPHAGRGAIGAKWEEILVVQDGRARWLDDETPNVRQWRRIEAGLSYGPEPDRLERSPA